MTTRRNRCQTVTMATRVLMDEVVETDYGQLDLWFDAVDEADLDGDLDKTFVGQLNGLVGAAVPGHVYVSLARQSGGSPVRVEAWDTEPPMTEDWEDIVEVSTVVGADATASGRVGAIWTVASLNFRLARTGSG